MSTFKSAAPDFDVIVIGGGMAGLTAAMRSIELDKRVLVLEKTDHPGGSAAMSAGILWTAPNTQVLKEILPEGDQKLCGIVVHEYEAIVERVRAAGVSVSEEWLDHLGWGRACKVDIDTLIGLWAQQISDNGTLHYGVQDVQVHDLDTATVGGAALRQVSYTTLDGETHAYTTANLIVATGGIQGDPLLRQTFIGAPADKMAVRSNPGSVGDGFRIGSQLGGAASKHLSAFYGHTLPSPLAVTEQVALRMTLYFSNRGIVINRQGQRFSNEGLGDEVTTQALVHQPGQRAILMWDDEAHQHHTLAAPYPSGMVLDRHAEAGPLGARTAKTDTIAELMDTIEAWGVDAASAQKTLDNYKLAAQGRRVPVDAPIPDEPASFATPPFRAMEIQPCITLPFGGLAVDEWARLLNHDGHPIDGVYVAGGDAGGMQDQRYVGGLIFAMVYGLRAAEAAANRKQ